MRVILVLCATILALPAQAAEMQGYRATYRLTVPHPAEGIAQVEGRMTREVRDTCAGWFAEQDAQIDITLHDGTTETAARQSESTEAHDGRAFEFSSGYASRSTTATLTGTAARSQPSAPWQLRFSRMVSGASGAPQTQQLSADTLFPVSYIQALVQALENGEQAFIAPLFNGVDPNPLEYTSRLMPARPLPGLPALAGLRGWMVEQRMDGQDAGRAVLRQIAENGVLVRTRETTDLGVLNWEAVEITLLPRACE